MTRPLLSGLARSLWSLLLFWLTAGRPACAADLPCGEGEPLARYFSPRDYQAGAQCLCATQDSRGVMYIGSLGRILEYDGSAWRYIDVDSNYADSLAYEAATDTIFVGALNNLGYLQTLPGGERKFVSLLDQLPVAQRDVGDVEHVYITAEGIYFVGTRQVMRWRGGRFRTWELATTSYLKSGVAAGTLYVCSLQTGLLRMRGDVFEPASDDPFFRRVVINAIVGEANGGLLVATSKEGLFEWREGAIQPLACECADFLRQSGINEILRLRDGSLAIATRTAGLLILDPALCLRTRLYENGGLKNKNIFGLFEDAEGGLWICLQAGVARAEVNSSLSILRAGADDDMSSAYCAAHWFGAMVLGTNTGLFRVTAADPAAAIGAHLERLPGTDRTELGMGTVENGVLSVTNDRLCFLGPDAKQVPVADEIISPQDLRVSHVHPGRVYVVDQQGQISTLGFDRAAQKWVSEGVAATLGVQGGQFALAESARGDLWVMATEHGLYRVELVGTGPARVTPFIDRPGPMQGDRYVAIWGGGGISPLIFKTSRAFCEWDETRQDFRVMTEFGKPFYDGTYHLSGGISYESGSLWITASEMRDPMSSGLRGRLVAGGNGREPVFQPLPHRIMESIGGVGIFDPVDIPPAPLTTLLLIGTTGNGIVRMNVRRWEAELASPRPFATLVRRATVVSHSTADNPATPISNDPLPYTRNSVHFEFAAGTLALGAAPRFQTRLVNLGSDDWSDFSERNSVDYLNLPEGRYIFEVRARNADGQLGTVASLPFRVLPPWQRTGWAYAAYALALAAGTAGLVVWRGWRLRRRNAALETLVDARTGELRQREAELVRARDDAESANRAKSAFLANMSHELRTPLNAVLGYTQLLLKQPDLAPRSRERITVIGQSGGHLLSLVNEVLDLSKVEAGKLTLSQFDFSLPGLLGEVGAAFRPRLIEKGLTFKEERAPGLPVMVHTDPSRLRQVLFNLLSNAVKFTHRGGVTLTVRPASEGRVRFEVTDTGVGIASEDQRNIFLAFHQTGESSLASQGTGLGLTISQRLVELLGGRIELESVPGQGSRFWFELPLTAVEPSGGLSAHVAPQDPVLGKVTGYEGATRRLLLVDDLTENRRVLLDFLQPLGFEIEEAANGKDCLAACARQMPDALLLDLRLGTPDGFEVARTLRAGEGATHPGIIAISASVFESDRQQAIDAGCDDFLPKPFEEAQLLGALGRVLGLRWLREATPTLETPATGAPVGEGTLPASEIDLLRKLSLSGDVAGIRRRLDAWRTADMPGREDEIVRRLESLAAAYDMEGIHDLLLTIHPHDGN